MNDRLSMVYVLLLTDELIDTANASGLVLIQLDAIDANESERPNSIVDTILQLCGRLCLMNFIKSLLINGVVQ